MSYIDDLITVQNDAFDNLYDIAVTFPKQLQASISDIHLRLRSQDVTIPEPKVDGYKIPYKTVEIEKPKPKIIMDRKLSIPFRVDANYALYEVLKEWQELTFTDDGNYTPLNAGRYGKIIISTYASAEGLSDGRSNRAKKWTFDFVWFAGFENGIGLKRAGGDPILVTADFKFFKMSRT